MSKLSDQRHYKLYYGQGEKVELYLDSIFQRQKEPNPNTEEGLEKTHLL